MDVAVITLGCPKNLVDTEVMLGLLDEAGLAFVDEPEGADVVIVNTCAFISAALEESGAVVRHCLSLKEKGLVQHVVLVGCLPQRLARDTFVRFPGADAVVGCSHFHEIVDVVRSVARGTPVYRVETPRILYDHRSPRVLATPGHIAYVKIAEGCDNMCSYCTIPGLRGSLRSRDPESVVLEAAALLERGVKEINLIAQDTSAYGTDIAQDLTLSELLRELSSVGMPWIRLLYAHPAHLTREILSVIATEDSIVPYIDVPVQHVSDSVLSRMGRPTTGSEVRDLFASIRDTIPDVTVRTSLMVGFPGEGETEFAELLDFVKAGSADYVAVFEYSPEPGTAACDMSDRAPDDTVSRRAQLIVEAAAAVAAARGADMIGRELDVLVDSTSPTPAGRTPGQAWEIDGMVFLKGEQNTPGVSEGEFVPSRIIGASGFDLAAEPVRR